MSQMRKRQARLSSTSSPNLETERQMPPSARRMNRIMRLITSSPESDVEMPPPATVGVKVLKTPRGSLKGSSDTLETTPGGSVPRRQVRTPSPTLSVTTAERLEALDLTDDELEGEPEKLAFCKRYIGQGIAPTVPVTPSTAAEDVRPSCSGMTDAPSRRRAKRDAGSDIDSDLEADMHSDVVDIHTVCTGREIPNDDNLDQSTRNIITSVETAMDDEIDRLVGVDSGFDWVEDFDTFWGVPETFSGPAPGPLKIYDTPHDAFTDIWSRDIMERIANETNKYAKQTINTMKANETMKPSSRLLQWTDTDADEIMILFAVYMFMGIDRRTSQKEYWMSGGYLAMPKFKELMTYSRYILLSKFLHFVDNVDVGQHCPPAAEAGLSPRLAKLVPVISHLNEKFSSLYNLEKNISIDESLTLFKGRLSWVQAIRTKAARIGIKSYELCESRTGYMAKFQIYAGKNSNTDADVAPSVDLGGKTTKLVLELLQGLERRGHCVTMDNFYNCPALARHLKNCLGFDCMGTLRPNRKHVPNEVANVSKNASKGTIIARHCGEVSVLAWKDTEWVHMISTCHGAETYVGQKAGKSLVKPVVVKDYNNTMGGVDLKDQKLSMYLLERKRCVKWYIKMFKRLLNVSIHNAFVMHAASLNKEGKPPMTHREFRYALANSLVEQHRRRSVLPPLIIEPTDQPIRLRRDVLHSPMIARGHGNEKRCAVHQRLDTRKLVHTKCATCDVFLCFETCWEEWHSLANLKGREIRGRKRKRD